MHNFAKFREQPQCTHKYSRLSKHFTNFKHVKENSQKLQEVSQQSPSSQPVASYHQAVIEAQNGSWGPLIEIYKQVKPKQWGNYLAVCYGFSQKYHEKAIVNTGWHGEDPF